MLCSFCASTQTQTTGRITGEVTDIRGAVIVGAGITAENIATGDRRSAATDQSGAFGISFLPPSEYRLSIAASGFAAAIYNHVTVTGAATATVNAKLEVAPANIQVEVNEAPPVIQSSSSELATTLNVRALTSMPLPTRNFMQLAALAPGVTMPVTDNRAVGRNTPNFSVNGARFSQNSLQINGMDATDNAAHSLGAVAVPAPESIREVVVQTSLYDASINGAGGGRRAGHNPKRHQLLHGSVYEYFRNDALNANDPDLQGGWPRKTGAPAQCLWRYSGRSDPQEPHLLLPLVPRNTRDQRRYRSKPV